MRLAYTYLDLRRLRFRHTDQFNRHFPQERLLVKYSSLFLLDRGRGSFGGLFEESADGRVPRRCLSRWHFGRRADNCCR